MKVHEFLLSVIATVVVLQLIVLCSLYDHLKYYDYDKIEKFDQISVGSVRVDTITAQEIEIFPLMDLDGNIIE